MPTTTLAAYALDAVGDDDRLTMEEFLAQRPAADAELHLLLEVTVDQSRPADSPALPKHHA